MDTFTMRMVMRNWLADAKLINESNPETFEDPIGFFIMMGGCNAALQLEAFGKIENSTATRIFNDFCTKNKNDIATLTHLVQQVKDDPKTRLGP